MKQISYLSVFVAAAMSLACQSHPPAVLLRVIEQEESFKAYWYQGLAEITSFELRQQRYGAEHQGEAVLIFVTEDFSKQKQVKLDRPESATQEDILKVLKLNSSRSFITGIYPYQAMISTFTPVFEDSPSPKISGSVTEWCGISYTEFRHGPKGYQINLHSYFEQEADTEWQLDALPEDELWNLIRLKGSQVPVGTKTLIPGIWQQRISHNPFEAVEANLSLSSDEAIPELELYGDYYTYSITYPSRQAELHIFFEKEFPFRILGWRERIERDKDYTLAIRKADMMTDYWRQNRPEYEIRRRSLGLGNP